GPHKGLMTYHAAFEYTPKPGEPETCPAGGYHFRTDPKSTQAAAQHYSDSQLINMAKKAEEARSHALGNNDADAFAALCDKDFIHVDRWGATRNLEQFRAQMKSGDIRLLSHHLFPETINCHVIRGNKD